MFSLCGDKLFPNIHVVSAFFSFSSVAQLCPTLCDPMDCSTQCLPVYHQLLEFTETHVHWVGEAIQPSHPVSSSSLPAFSLSQHQGLFFFFFFLMWSYFILFYFIFNFIFTLFYFTILYWFCHTFLYTKIKHY